MVKAPLAEGVVGRAIGRGVIDVGVHDLRDFTTDRHRVVDDMPFGGGPGMVMKPEPFFAAVDHIRRERGAPDAIVLTSPDGDRFGHRDAERLSGLGHVVMLCGRYEGVDERVRRHLATEALSIGDYVLSGGELPALVMLDAIARLVPGVVGDEESVARDSFVGGLLDYPQYTRPAGISGARGAGGVAVGPPRGDRAVAAARGAGENAARGGRTCSKRRRSTTRTARCCATCE